MLPHGQEPASAWQSVTPRIVTEDVTGLVDFLRRAFNATGEVHPDRPGELDGGAPCRPDGRRTTVFRPS